MATTTANPAASNVNQSSSLTVLIPYAIAILAQLPMLLLYFRDLWSRAHYQFFPFAILASVAFAYARWPRDLPQPFHRSIFSNVLMGIGLFFGLLAGLFPSMGPWFSAASVMTLVASLLVRTTDGETLGSLGVTALPFFTALILPMRFDTWLIVKLQRISSWITSSLLDLAGLKHYNVGTVIQVPGTEGYGIEEMCSGVQSFFTLLFFAVVLIVLFRRTFVRSVLLVLAAVFWAIFMNTLRIVTIPIAAEYGIDLVHGVKHDMLGYAVLILGLFFLFSTDQLIQAILGSHAEGGVLTRAWKAISGDKKKKRTRRSLSKGTKGLLWTSAGILLLSGILQFSQVAMALADPTTKINFFDPNVTVAFAEGDVPNELANWRKVDYSSETRSRSADLGLRSDAWQFAAPRCSPRLSFDQTFPGWHELTVCYQNAGWELIDRERIVPKYKRRTGAGEELDPWPYIEAKFKQETGEYGYLLFCLFDAKGEPLAAPAEWNGIGAFLTRLKGRMTHKIRASLFQSEAYQTQVFIQSYGEPGDGLKNEIRDRFFVAREALRSRFLEKQGLVQSSEQAATTLSSPETAAGNGLGSPNLTPGL